MKIPSNILHDKQYADKILEITADTMFFVYKDGTCLDFKANTTDFFIKEQDIIGRNIFSYFPVETAREMYAEFIKVRAGDKPSARNYKLILEDDVKYYKCIISKYDEEHFLFQYRDITGRSVVRLKLEKYNPQIQISAESETKRSIFREKDKTKRSKKESAQHSKSRNKSFVMTSVSAL